MTWVPETLWRLCDCTHSKTHRCLCPTPKCVPKCGMRGQSLGSTTVHCDGEGLTYVLKRNQWGTLLFGGDQMAELFVAMIY